MARSEAALFLRTDKRTNKRTNKGSSPHLNPLPPKERWKKRTAQNHFQMITVNDPRKLLEEEGAAWVAPDTSPQLIADINSSPQLRRWKEECVKGSRAKYELGILRQRQVAEATRQIDRCYMDGLGSLRASFDAEVFYRLEIVRGKGWWRDPKEFAKFLKENPMFAVTARHRRFAIRIAGFRDRPDGRKRERSCRGTGAQAVSHAAAGDPPRALRCAHETATPIPFPDARKSKEAWC